MSTGTSGPSGSAAVSVTAATESTADPTVGSSVGSSSSGDGECPGLRDAEPILVSEDDVTIDRVRIVSDGVPAIDVRGHSGVTIRNVEILHRGAPGILFANADDILIEDVIIVHDGAPDSGPHDEGGQANIEGRDSDRVVINRVRVVRGSSGIDLSRTPGAHLSFIEGHDVRGPGLAAFVGFLDADDALLEDFSILNPLDTGRPFNLIAVAQTSNVVIRRGLMDGNNAQFGYGVNITHVGGQSAGGLVEDVDGVRMTNGAFSCWPSGFDITFRRTRSREGICEILSVPIDDCKNPGPNGGCIPGSGGTVWTASPSSSNIVIEDSAYHGLCTDAVWPTASITIAEGDLIEDDFEPRPPIVVSPCWDPA